MTEVKVKKVEYWRQVKPPTLKQFLMREVFKEASKKNKGVTGVSPDGNRVLPDSAINMRDKLKGVTAKEIAERRPDLVDEYRTRFGKGR